MLTSHSKVYSYQVELAIYGPMIYTAPYVTLLMRANPLRGQVGGDWALEIDTFLGPVKWHRAVKRVPFGAQKKHMYIIHTCMLAPLISTNDRSRKLCMKCVSCGFSELE